MERLVVRRLLLSRQSCLLSRWIGAFTGLWRLLKSDPTSAKSFQDTLAGGVCPFIWIALLRLYCWRWWCVRVDVGVRWILAASIEELRHLYRIRHQNTQLSYPECRFYWWVLHVSQLCGLAAEMCQEWRPQFAWVESTTPNYIEL